MPITTNVTRSYVQGETVHLRVRTALPGTKTPEDVTSVRLTSLLLRESATEALSAPVDFDHVAKGDYALAYPTDGLTPGTYATKVVADDGPAAVRILLDEFVVTAG